MIGSPLYFIIGDKVVLFNSLAKIFVTRTLTRDLFAVTSLSVYSVWAY